MNNDNLYQVLSPRGEIAIFWDFDSYYENVDVTNPELFATELVNATRLFRPELERNAHSVLRVYGDFSATGHINFVSQLQAAGFEVTDTAGWTVDAKNNICMLILLWLYDSEKIRKNNWNPCVVVVSKDKIFVNLLAKLFARGVCVVSINDLAESMLSEWKEVSSFLLNFGIPNHSTVNFNMVSSIDNTIPASTQTVVPRASGNIDFETGAMVRNVNTGNNNSNVSDYTTRHDWNDLVAISEEQQQLQDELAFAIRSQNVQLTIARLRKIYTKQFRGYRIPTILGTISYGSGPDRVLNYSEIAFILGCIQWCYGGQKGDNVDAFTYKMNKSLARWLLKDLQNKHFASTIYAEIFPVVVVTVQNILKQVVEFDFCLELLQFLNVENPLGILSPQVYTWGFSSNASQALRAKHFALQQGFPDSFFHNHMSSQQGSGYVATEVSGNSNSIGISGVGGSMTGGECLGTGTGTGTWVFHETSNSGRNNFPVNRQRVLLDGVHGDGQGGSRNGGVALYLNTPFSSQNTSIRPPAPSTTASTPPPPTPTTTSTIIPPWLQRRIINTISMFPNCVSETQLLEVYSRQYGEPLGLSGRRLHEAISGLDNVEIMGSGMSGEAYYKVTKLSYEMKGFGSI